MIFLKHIVLQNSGIKIYKSLVGATKFCCACLVMSGLDLWTKSL